VKPRSLALVAPSRVLPGKLGQRALEGFPLREASTPQAPWPQGRSWRFAVRRVTEGDFKGVTSVLPKGSRPAVLPPRNRHGPQGGSSPGGSGPALFVPPGARPCEPAAWPRGGLLCEKLWSGGYGPGGFRTAAGPSLRSASFSPLNAGGFKGATALFLEAANGQTAHRLKARAFTGLRRAGDVTGVTAHGLLARVASLRPPRSSSSSARAVRRATAASPRRSGAPATMARPGRRPLIS